MPDDYDMFISHAHTDGRDHAEKLYDALKAKGYRPWFDQRDLDYDQDFSAELEKGIEASRAVVVCITPESKAAKSFVRREIIYASLLNKPIIPLRFAEIPPHISIDTLIWIDFFREWDVAFAQLLARLEKAFAGIFDTPTPRLDDPFRDYLKLLYEDIVADLSARIIADPIDLSAGDAPGKVKAPRRRLDPMLSSATRDEKRNFKTFAEWFDFYKGRALLLGEPGAGKSITLMNHARQAVVERLDDPTKPLPFVRLIARWDEKMPLHAWLAESYELDTDAVRREVENGRALLLLDGLDELRKKEDTPPLVPLPEFKEGIEKASPHEHKTERIDRRIAFLRSLPANNRILITCRVADYEQLGEQAALNGAIILHALTDSQISEYLRGQPELLALLQSDDSLREMIRTPLLMSFFAFAYDGADESERQQFAELKSAGELRDKIFDRYIRQRYAHEIGKGAEIPFSVEDLIEKLGKLAMDNIGQLGGEENVLELYDLRRYISVAQIQVFTDWALHLDLLLPSDSNTVRFIHVLLRDSLAFPCALSHLRDPNEDVSMTAVAALEVIADVRALDPLIRVLGDPEYIGYHAGLALIRIGQPAVEALINVLTSNNIVVRQNAAGILGWIGDASAIKPLISLLSDIEEYDWGIPVCDSAANALERIGTPEALKAAADYQIRSLDHTRRYMRSRAANALTRIGTPEALQAVAEWRKSQADN